jgi:hypothetical protein
MINANMPKYNIGADIEIKGVKNTPNNIKNMMIDNRFEIQAK